MSTAFTINSGTADGSIVTVTDASVLTTSQVMATLTAAQTTGIVGLDVATVAAGSFGLRVRTATAGGTSSGSTTGTYTVTNSAFDVTATTTLKTLTVTGALTGTLTGGGTAATATVLGDVKVPSSGNLSVDGAGAISAGAQVPLLNANNSFATAGDGGASGTAVLFGVAPTLTQSGTACYTALDVNATETSTGSGTKNLANLRVGGTSKFSVDDTGAVTAAGTITGNGSSGAASGTYVNTTIAPTLTQSGTAAYTALKINATETSTGSGSKLLADMQVGGTSQFKVDDAGNMTSLGSLVATAVKPARSLPTMSGSTVTLDPTVANSFVLAGVHNTQATQNVALGSAPPAGQFIFVLARADATGQVVYTFTTSFKSTGTVTVNNNSIAVVFVSDGTNAWEVGRSASAIS